MREGLEQADIDKLQEQIAARINDLACNAAQQKGKNVGFMYGRITSLIETARLIDLAQEGDL